MEVIWKLAELQRLEMAGVGIPSSNPSICWIIRHNFHD
jgi:hypothetical protein